MPNSLQPHGLQHARLPRPPPTPRACSNSCAVSQWYHPTISSSIVPFSSCFNLSQHQSLFRWASHSHQVVKVLALQLQHQSFQWIFRTYIQYAITQIWKLPQKLWTYASSWHKDGPCRIRHKASHQQRKKKWCPWVGHDWSDLAAVAAAAARQNLNKRHRGSNLQRKKRLRFKHKESSPKHGKGQR